MSHRLTTSMRRVDRILKNARLTGNFSNPAQFQPRDYKCRQFRWQSSVNSAQESPRKTRQSFHKKDAKIKGKRDAEKQRISYNNASSGTSSPDMLTVRLTLSSKPPKATIEVTSKDDSAMNKLFALAAFAMILEFCNILKQMKEMDLAGKLVAGAGLARLKELDEKWERIRTTPKASVDGAKIQKEAPVVDKEKFKPERNLPAVEQKNLRFRLSTSFFSYESYWPPARC